MKRIFCLTLVLVLLCGCMPAIAQGAEELMDVLCEEQGFSTKIPAAMTAVYEEGPGLRISVEKPGYVPYVLVSRRPLEMKLNNPVNYLNNVYREYMEEQYGSNMIGTNPCKEYEIGGKTLLGAQYKYKVNSNTLCLLHLIEVREDGDVEYSAKFLDGKGDAAMETLEIAVKYYQTDLVLQAESANELPLETADEVLQDGLTAAYCAEEEYTIKVPEDAIAEWNDADGVFFVWLDDYGYVPNVYISRRTGEYKLKNPENYVKNVFTNYMKETYGDNLRATSLFESYEIGGKQLLGAAYVYKAPSGNMINQMLLVEVRPDGDVEYIARYLNSERESTLAALDAIVRSYQPESIPVGGSTEKTGSVQLNISPAKPIVSGVAKYSDGRFTMNLPQGWQIMTQSEYMSFCFKAWDPSNPNRTIFLFMKLEPFLKGDAAKAWYRSHSDGGDPNNIYSLYSEAPVMQSCTLQAFLDTIPQIRDYCDLYYSAGWTINSAVLPQMTNVKIIERNQSTMPAPADCKENIVARISYEDYLGQSCEGLVTAEPRDPMQYIIGGVDTVPYTVNLFMGVTAPVGELVELEPTLVDCLSSFAFEQSYVNQAIQVSIEQKEQLQAQMRQMEAAHDAMMQAWYAREQAHDIAFQKLSDSIMGYDRLYDSSTGEVYLADVGFYDTYNLHRYEYSNSNLQLIDSGSQQYYLEGVDYYITK